MDDRIRIQNQDVFSRSLADAGVVPASESEVGAVLHYADSRELLTNLFDRTIR